MKQKDVFQELLNERMGEIQNLTKHIDFKNLIYHFKGKVVQKVLSVKGPLAFSQKYITLEKAEEKQTKIKSDINEIAKRRYRLEGENVQKEILQHFTNHEKKLLNCLMIF